MAEVTGISWCDSTANFWIGCQKVSPACDDCYAEDLMGTTGSRLKQVEWGPGGERRFCKQGWADVKRWQRRAEANGGLDPELGRRRRIFVNSLSDFFDNHRSVKWRGDAWHLIRRSPNLIFLLLTKRPQLIGRYLPPFWGEIAERVWLLTTTENQEWAQRRVPELLNSCQGRARPAVFGVSCEPLLGPIDFNALADGHENLNALTGLRENPFGATVSRRYGEKLDWVITGGKSGKAAREAPTTDPFWFRDLRDQCDDAAVAFHLKQWGEWGPVSDLQPGDRVFTRPHPDYPESEGFIRTSTTMRLLGKHAAGNTIDGRQHMEFPLAA